jgi:MFS transporter, OFA family, oxalate/formate antiporter
MKGRDPSLVYGSLVVFSGFLILAFMYGTLYSFGVFLKPMLDELGFSQRALSGAYSLCFLLSGVLALLMGRLNDRVGPRAVVSFCALLIGCGWFFSSRAGALWEFYLYFGVLVGVGMSGGITPVLSTVAKWFVSRRGVMTGIAVAGVGVGTMLLPPILNSLVDAYGWRVSFALTGLTLFALVTGLAQLLARDPQSKKMEPYGAEKGIGPATSRAVAGLSVREACRTRRLWMLFAVYVLAGFVIQAVLVHLALHAIISGISPARGAVLLSAVGLGGLGGRIVGGLASDRFGNRLTMMIALFLMAAGFALLLLSLEWGVLLLFAILFGIAYGEILCMMPLLPAELFGLKNHGAIMGIITCASTIGGGLGPVAAGSLFDRTGAYNVLWTVCLAFTILAFFLVVGLKGRRSEWEATPTDVAG